MRDSLTDFLTLTENSPFLAPELNMWVKLEVDCNSAEFWHSELGENFIITKIKRNKKWLTIYQWS